MKKVICHDINNEEYEVDSDQLSFRPSVYGVLIEDGKILLSKQWDGYDFPGGGVEIHETLEEALKREFMEETGIEIEIKKFFHSTTSFFKPIHSKRHSRENWNCPVLVFIVKKVGGELSKENFDEEEKDYADLAEWVDLDKIDNLKFITSLNPRSVIKKVLKFIN